MKIFTDDEKLDLDYLKSRPWQRFARIRCLGPNVRIDDKFKNILARYNLSNIFIFNI
jgi:hypothetical protein